MLKRVRNDSINNNTDSTKNVQQELHKDNKDISEQKLEDKKVELDNIAKESIQWSQPKLLVLRMLSLNSPQPPILPVRNEFPFPPNKSLS